jgi:hypothetical protein
MHSSNSGFQSKFATISLALMLVTLWLLMHGYHGLTGDGQIYAFQALARLHPQLATDLYLQNTSQDQFTLFSPLYAQCIGLLGLENAARLLTLIFTIWFLAAAWSFAARLAGPDSAWLAVATLLIVGGDYGASGVFRILDPFLTARLPAEALIITALSCHARGMKRLSLLAALGALLIHPLIALPGLLLIICLWLPIRVGVIGAIAGTFTALAAAIVATNLPTALRAFAIMDAQWLDVVQERSQFLFLHLWTNHDWGINALSFISVGITALSVPDRRIRKLCSAAALVGVAGLAVALIGDLIGPVAIVVQGQAWRWVWITVCIGALLVPVTVLHVWHDEKCGLPCALLLVAAWTLPGGVGTACAMLAFIIWSIRACLDARFANYFRWAAAGFGLAIMVWILTKCWPIVSPPIHPSLPEPLGESQMQRLFALKIPAVLLVMLTWWVISLNRGARVPIVLSVILTGLSIFILPAAFRQSRSLASAADIHEFADWINIIPPTSTVLVTPARDVGAFVWFTLGRPNYLTLDESAGVVFSRATALEVRRRSEVLLPLMDPDWKILTRLRAKSDKGRKDNAVTRRLTSKNLILICADPGLGFVISPENVGFDPLRHGYAGAWMNWNLYDCRKARAPQHVLQRQ